MAIRFRTFTGADYAAVCAFLVELNRDDRGHIHWNWARFEWMYRHPEFDASLKDAIGLWLDGERIVGAAIYDMYFGEAFCAVLPGYEALYADVLDYACAHLKDETGLAIAIGNDNAFEIETAKREGFFPIEQTETVMRRGLDDALAADLPAGLSFRELDQTADLDTLEWVIYQGFDHGDDRAAFEASRVRTGPRMHFDRRLSVAAVDETGEPVAFCGMWYLPGTDYAYVEPVCTVPAWRKRGVGRAVVIETMRRAKALGARDAYVISDQAFYAALGFAIKHRYTFYRKP
jgi:predicted N-acetyltransferase YhbS